MNNYIRDEREAKACDLSNEVRLFNNNFILVRNKHACNIYKYLVKDFRHCYGDNDSLVIDVSTNEVLILDGCDKSGNLKLYLRPSYSAYLDGKRKKLKLFTVPIDEFIRLISGNKDINITDEMRNLLSYENNYKCSEYDFDSFDVFMFGRNYNKLLSILGIL